MAHPDDGAQSDSLVISRMSGELPVNIAILVEEFQQRGIVLWANGDRLGYRSPKGALGPADLASLRSHKAEILEYLRAEKAIEHDGAARFMPFGMTDIQRAYATGQHAGYELGGTGCHSYAELRTQPVGRERLERAWHELIRRHDMLSAFVLPPDSLRVVPPEELPVERMPRLEEIDLRGHDPQSPDEEHLRHRREMEERSYPLGAWPLHCFRILQFEECSILQFSIDMIIADFISVSVMVEELMDLYEGKPLEPLPRATFRDVLVARAIREETPAGRAEYESAKEYWLGRIGSMPERPSLPILTAPQRCEGETVRFTRHSWRCGPAEWALLVERAAAFGVTPSNVLLTAYIDVIRRWSSQPEFCVNITSMNRGDELPGVERIVGDFTEVSVHASRRETGSFLERVCKTQEQLVDELSHSAFGGLDVLRELGRARGGSAVVPIVFTGALGAGLRRREGRALELVHGVSRTPQVWIDCQAFEEAGGCNINWDVREGILAPAVLEAMWEAFTEALERLLGAEEEPWHAEDIVQLGERQQQVRERIHRRDAPLAPRTLQTGFWGRAQSQPEACALVCGGESFSYSELAGHVQAVDAQLSGVGRGDRVAIVLGKGVWQVAAVLAVVSRGAAYVPVDHDQPSARQRRMISLCRPRAIIADANYRATDGQLAVVDVDALGPLSWDGTVPVAGPAEDTAYIIFTSGSTGTPKGVVMTHTAAMNTIEDVNQRLAGATPRTVLGLSKLSFDLSVYDVFGTFASGGRLVLPLESEAKDPSSWIELMRTWRVDTWNSVPALFQMLLAERVAAGLAPDEILGLVLLSGDLIARTLPAQAASHFPRAELVSLGGATEGGIWSIHHRMNGHTGEENIPYGSALSRQGMYVLDAFMNECPDGVRGRIHISGESLASGYFNDPETTERKFFFSAKQGRRLYDTGDIGSYRPDGVIDFHGRADTQVKINGYRVEIGEIEAVLEEHQDIGRAVVVVEEADGRKKLRAFVTPAQQQGSSAADEERADTPEALGAALRERWSSGDAGGPDAACYAAWTKAGNEAALAALLAAFVEAGLFTEPGAVHSQEQIVARLRPDPEYRELVGRWLGMLTAEGVLQADEGGFTLTSESLEHYRMAERWDHFAAMEARVLNSSALFEYQHYAAGTLLRQIRGEVNPLELFFPGGRTDNAHAIYAENRISEATNAAVAEAVARVAESRGDRPIRVLEIGAGVGASTTYILPKLPENIAEYRFTDLSTFFLRNARESYRDYGFMSYGLFDINAECAGQDVELGAYDVIVCANVLHNAVNIDQTFARLNQLRRPDGVIVMIEPVTELYAALISISIKMSLVEFTDVRADGHRVFLDEEQWEGVFTRAGLRRIAEYPGRFDPLRECGQRLFVLAEPGARRIDEEELTGFLREMLPGYMVPASLTVMDAMPLSANGKIDRKALLSSFTSRQESEEQPLAAPQGGLEERIAALWRDVLENERIGRDEDFYAAGGDSLLMAKAVTRMRQEIDALKDQSWDLIMREMLKKPTVAGIAEALGGGAVEVSDPQTTADTVVATDGARVAPSGPAVSSPSAAAAGAQRLHVYGLGEDQGSCRAFFHAGTGRIKDYDLLVPALMERSPATAHVGFTSGDADEYLASPTDALIAERARLYAQDLLELDMDSYELVGYCIGGFFALETAKILTELGRRVCRVVAVSTHLCPHRIANEMLCEFAYGCVVEADPRALGADFSIELLREGLEHILGGQNRDITDEELCALDGRYASLGSYFSACSRMSPKHRRRRIYETVKGYENDAGSARAMLEILYDVFRHSLRGTIGYRPDVYLGTVLALQPERGVDGFYPSLGGDVDWPSTVLGQLRTGIISGSHSDCLTEKNYRSILAHFEQDQGD